MSEMTLYDVSMQPLNAFNLIEQLKAENEKLQGKLKLQTDVATGAKSIAMQLQAENEKANKGIDKSKEALNEAYSTIAALEQALKEVSP